MEHPGSGASSPRPAVPRTTYEATVRALERLGLPGLEARLYLALLQEGPSTAPDLAHRLGIHRVHAYRLLDRLQSKGAAEVSAVRPRLYLATRVDALGRARLAEMRRALAADAAMLRQLTEALGERPERGGARFQVYRDRAGWETRILAMVARAEGEILASVRSEDRLGGRPLWLRLAAAGRDGRTVRIVLDRAPPRPPPAGRTGAEMRIRRASAPWLIVVDRAEGLVALADPPEGRRQPAAAWSSDRGFVESQRLLFRSLWASALPSTPGAGTRQRDSRASARPGQ
ncbi:MAG: helix-turn-helix domain-containing protein [Thermoplasmata archaeon]